MKLYLILAFILISINAHGNELKKNYLVPELSAFSGVTLVTDYYAYLVKIFPKAFNPEDSRVKIRVVVTPSFKKEYVIGIKEKDSRYFAFKYKSKKQIWYEYGKALKQKTLNNPLKAKIAIVETETEIPEELYKTIETLWNQMIIEAKFQRPTGLDGTTYHFSNSSLFSASAWSPDSESRTGYLVKIAELLGQLTESKNKTNIENSIMQIATRLKGSL